jgi:hypothetical protein
MFKLCAFFGVGLVMMICESLGVSVLIQMNINTFEYYTKRIYKTQYLERFVCRQAVIFQIITSASTKPGAFASTMLAYIDSLMGP